ncbi:MULTISPECIES: MMPL family transporter [Streptomyces violaceusniger group]|uniref:MMPL family transporter n=3 Tax=Streptomyces rhizosphaericus TaxID=114699 RepID=A0ABN1R050_9ACTN|nr:MULTISPECIES: MMPL family transporter [Streptomyces violaceusniger group]
MATLLYRLGAFGARRWRTMVIGWLIVLAAVIGLGLTFGGSFQNSDSIPGSPAQTALTRMDRHWPEPDKQSAQVVFQAPPGHKLSEPGFQGPLRASLAAAGKVAGVTAVGDPAQDGMVSPDGRTAVAQVGFSTAKDSDVPTATLDALKATGATATKAGLTVVYGGDAYAPTTSPVGPTELIGILVALAILVITFGSLLSAGMPLLTAVLGVVGSMMATMGLASAVGISENAPTLAVMLGLAVGIDYALLIVSRHRAHLASGMPVGESVAKATATAGSAVVFAGATVLIALAGLSLAGVPMLTSMGLASAGAVAMAMIMALTLLPAVMSAFGRRLVPKPGSRAARTTHPARTTMGAKWVSGVLRHPVRYLIVVTVGLLVIAAPALQLKMALTDDGSNAKGTATRQAYDTIGHAFGPGANGPLIVLVEGADAKATAQTAAAVKQKLKGIDGIADISGIDTAKDLDAARIQVIPTTGPRTQATSRLVSRLNEVTGPVARHSGSYVAVTGQTAVSIDVSTKLSGALVPFAVVVVGLSLLLLLIAFRSLAIPIKATAGFLLSVSSAFGAMVAVFQWGWLADLLGVPSLGPVGSFVPIIVMAVLFGLAMDYEVFLVSAMREEYGHRKDARRAIVVGARNASRIVTSAALIMIAVFVDFVFGKDPDVMPIAFGLAFGVLVDAFLVRMTLVPAVLALLGDRAWWLPRRLERFLPHLDLEGESITAGPDGADRIPTRDGLESESVAR